MILTTFRPESLEKAGRLGGRSMLLEADHCYRVYQQNRCRGCLRSLRRAVRASRIDAVSRDQAAEAGVLGPRL